MKAGDFVFVYGTLKSGHGANSLMQGRSEFIREDRINGRMYNLGAFPGLKALGAETGEPAAFNAEEPTVSGEVYLVTNESLPDMLDGYEGYPSYYGRREFQTEHGFTVWAYEKNGERDERHLIQSGRWE